MLWHYTDDGGLQGILTSDSVWATNARFLNDSQELAHGIETSRKALANYDRSLIKPRTSKYLDDLSDPDTRLIANFLERTAEIFVACFCTNPDLLSQWRGYANKGGGGGYSIGFRPPGDLHAWPQAVSGGHQLSLRRVVYDPAEQDQEIADLIQRLVAILDANPDDPVCQSAFSAHLVNGIAEVASWFKHAAFTEEDEWRIVYVRTTDSDPLELRHRSGNGLVIPYVALPLRREVGYQPDALPIARIMCGPGAEPGLKIRGVQSFLDLHPKYDSVAVEGSTTPLRW